MTHSAVAWHKLTNDHTTQTDTPIPTQLSCCNWAWGQVQLNAKGFFLLLDRYTNQRGQTRWAIHMVKVTALGVLPVSSRLGKNTHVLKTCVYWNSCILNLVVAVYLYYYLSFMWILVTVFFSFSYTRRLENLFIEESMWNLVSVFLILANFVDK
jgi:hypothetical protein